MSKLNSNKISYNEKDFLVEVSEDEANRNQVSKQELILNRAQDEAEKEIENAKNEARKIVENAKNEALQESQKIINDANNQAESIIQEAQQQANNIIEESNIKKNELLTNSQTEIEHAAQEAANKGYEEGYEDAQKKFFEENEDKILAFDKFCSYQNSVKDKIVKNASRDILDIIQNIS